eukprot:GILI01010957.1.p1 GENE.GILI01010957.1~~GILI01010957.1.p1  ORF type:complete len:360 (+),score=65.84 GILI01010957.1:120-1199(+)
MGKCLSKTAGCLTYIPGYKFIASVPFLRSAWPFRRKEEDALSHETLNLLNDSDDDIEAPSASPLTHEQIQAEILGNFRAAFDPRHQGTRQRLSKTGEDASSKGNTSRVISSMPSPPPSIALAVSSSPVKSSCGKDQPLLSLDDDELDDNSGASQLSDEQIKAIILPTVSSSISSKSSKKEIGLVDATSIPSTASPKRVRFSEVVHSRELADIDAGLRSSANTASTIISSGATGATDVSVNTSSTPTTPVPSMPPSTQTTTSAPSPSSSASPVTHDSLPAPKPSSSLPSSGPSGIPPTVARRTLELEGESDDEFWADARTDYIVEDTEVTVSTSALSTSKKESYKQEIDNFFDEIAKDIS